MDVMGVDMVAQAAIATRNKGEKVGEKREMRKKVGGEGKRREKDRSLPTPSLCRCAINSHFIYPIRSGETIMPRTNCVYSY